MLSDLEQSLGLTVSHLKDLKTANLSDSRIREVSYWGTMSKYAPTHLYAGVLSNTVIADGTKIDALVHVGHNAQIGKNCILTAASIIGGSARIGDSSWMGLNCIIKQKVRVGSNVVIAAQACVVHDVSDGDVVAGVPARSIKDKVTTELTYMMAGQRNNAIANSLSITKISAGLKTSSHGMQTAAFLRNLYSTVV